MVLSNLVTAFVTLFLSVGVWISLLLRQTSCFFYLEDMGDHEKRHDLFEGLTVCKIIASPCINIINRFLFCYCYMISERIFFIVRLCLMPFSRRITYSYASCGLLVCASNSSAIFSFCMCAVNMSFTHSFYRSPQSAPDANSTRSA